MPRATAIVDWAYGNVDCGSLSVDDQDFVGLDGRAPIVADS